jgi:ABC-type nitrate/sulfonate/bicarbonate transport system permease component
MALEVNLTRRSLRSAPRRAARRSTRFIAVPVRTSGFLLVLGLLALWEMSARLGWVQSQNWPRFSDVVVSTWQGLVNGELLGILASSILRMLSGYAIGSTCAIVLGLIVGMSPLLDRFLTPVAEVLRPLPLPALVPPMILFLGLDDALKITAVAFAIFFPVFVSTVGGIRDVDAVLLATGRAFGASRMRIAVSIVLPAALPAICAGLRISLSLALVTTVVAEMIAGSSGIGYAILQAQYSLKPERMYAGVICVAAVGYLMNAGFIAIERRLLFWSRSSDHDL